MKSSLKDHKSRRPSQLACKFTEHLSDQHSRSSSSSVGGACPISAFRIPSYGAIKTEEAEAKDFELILNGANWPEKFRHKLIGRAARAAKALEIVRRNRRLLPKCT
ncbi:MAG: hypothetical protein WDN50_08250 [Bradyrhizobium sp.]